MKLVIVLLPLLLASLAIAKGPVGWDVYRQMDRIPELRTGVRTRQFSSKDKKGMNKDMEVTLRRDGTRYVLAEHKGPGEISTITSTRGENWGNVTNTGKITVELDGRIIIDHSYEEVVDGKLGAPFVWPMVGNASDASGLAVIYVPMPFVNYMRITVENNPRYYHIGYRTFSDAQGIKTFDPKDPALDVLDKLQQFGIKDPKPQSPFDIRFANNFKIEPKMKAQLAIIKGPGMINSLRFQFPQLVGSPYIIDDGRAFGMGGLSYFVARLDPKNNGARITRRYDPTVGHQVADLLVDGKKVGQWSSGHAAQPGQWADETIVLPPESTEGKHLINVTNVFVSSESDFSEFRYDIESFDYKTKEWIRTDVLDVGPNHPGEEKAHFYTNHQQTKYWKWNNNRKARFPVDSKAFADSRAILQQGRLRITFDDKMTVDTPIGEFFGSGLGSYDVRALMFSIDRSINSGWYTSWWPMPFTKQAVIEIINDSDVPITNGVVEVHYVPDDSISEKLDKGVIGYFHATYHRKVNVPDHDFNFLNVSGHGLFYGVIGTMRGLIPTGNRRDYLEGDEHGYVDGSLTPDFPGIGTEDWYGGGWYFRDDTPYAMPLTGNPAYYTDGDGCKYDCTGAYRILVADAASFESHIKWGIQHGPINQSPSDYSSVAFWYGHERPVAKKTDEIDVTCQESRQMHNYQAKGETYANLTSSFEGEAYKVKINGNVATATGAISFKVKIDPLNAGVRIFRISDHKVAYQEVSITVNGQQLVNWMQPLFNPYLRWLHDSYDLPPALTAGKSELQIQLTPLKTITGNDAIWTASKYEILTTLKV